MATPQTYHRYARYAVYAVAGAAYGLYNYLIGPVLNLQEDEDLPEVQGNHSKLLPQPSTSANLNSKPLALPNKPKPKAGVILVAGGTDILLVQQCDTLKWGFPKGREEEGDAKSSGDGYPTWVNTALRELKEETGVVLVDNPAVPPAVIDTAVEYGLWVSRVVGIRFLVARIDEKLEGELAPVCPPDQAEVVDVQWFPVGALPPMDQANQTLRTFVNEIKTGADINIFTGELAGPTPWESWLSRTFARKLAVAVPSAAGETATLTAAAPTAEEPLQPTKEEYPERPGEKDCTFYLKTGKCKFGNQCKFHHPKDRQPAAEEAGIVSVDLNNLGLPLRERCTYSPEETVDFLMKKLPRDHLNYEFPLLPEVYQLVEKAGPKGLAVVDLRRLLESTLSLPRTVKTTSLNAYLRALSGYFVLDETTIGGKILRVVARAGDVEAGQALVEVGADLNQADSKGCTPPVSAAALGLVGAVRTLAEAGADVNLPSFKGITPLLAAALEGNVAVTSALSLSRG